MAVSWSTKQLQGSSADYIISTVCLCCMNSIKACIHELPPRYMFQIGQKCFNQVVAATKFEAINRECY